MKFKVTDNTIWWNCPGCGFAHGLPIIGPRVLGNTGAEWDWNGSVESPTLSPSVHLEVGDDICHFFIKDGKVEFCSDSTHEFANMTVDLPEWNDAH